MCVCEGKLYECGCMCVWGRVWEFLCVGVRVYEVCVCGCMRCV